MYSLVIFLVFLILKAEANDLGNENPVLRLNCNYDSDEIYTVLKDKPLQIVIENCRTEALWCNAYYKPKVNGSEQFVPYTKYKTDSVTILNITKVKAEMSTRWKCTVLEEIHSPTIYKYMGNGHTAKDVYFHIHVKGAGTVISSVNNHNLTFVTANLSVNHDGDANYAFEDGEEVDFSCHKGTNHSDDLEIRLEYYNAEGVPLFDTKSRVQKLERQQIFRSVLKSENDKNYLDCILTTLSPKREYRYRTTFYMKKRAEAMQHAMILSVNGQKLTTFTNNDLTSDDYMFRYIEGEVLNVTCRKTNDNIKGTLIFSNETDYFGPALGSPEKEIILLNVSTARIHNKTLSCVINNTDVLRPNARILFLSDVPYNDVRIQGLPRNNVLYQYSKNLDQWTIEYQYSVNDTLHLTCVSKSGFHVPNVWQQSSQQQFYWKFQGQTIESPAISKNFRNVHFSNETFTKTLDATHDGLNILCVYDFEKKLTSKSVEIILRLKPVLDSELNRDGLISDSKVHLMVPLGSVGVAAAIITMICLAFWRKRSKRSSLIQNAYDNFSNQNDSPIPPFPNQWEANHDDSHYSKIDEGIMQENYNYAAANDKLHRMPYQRQSNVSENHYSEIDEYFKPKTDSLPTNWSNTLDKQANASHHFKSTPNFNNIGDLKQGTYDRLKHDNLPLNKDLNSSNLGIMGNQKKSVSFGPNLSSKQDAKIDDRRLNQASHNPYMNTDQGIYMKPGDMQKKPNYENHSVQNEKTDNPFDFDYAEPYSELGISRKNDFYGF